MSRWQIAADINAASCAPAARCRTKRPAPASMKVDEARARLESLGVPIAEFARTHGLPRAAVCDALRGKTKGLRGDAHRAAVLLGLKDGVIEREGGR